MTHVEIAEGIFKSLAGGKLIAVMSNQGPVPSFTLIFEDASERRGQLTFQPHLLVNVNVGVSETRAQIIVNVGDFTK